MSLLSKLTRRRHHFKILLTYRPEKGQERPFVSQLETVWMQDRSAIADDRQVKKAVSGNLFSQIPRHLKRNGTLEVSEVYYLGWFKPIRKSQRGGNA